MSFMEILIIGLILVALMVYTSTKIKAAVAAAYSEEKIQTPDFEIIKPDGFLSPCDDKSIYAFEAYSREFGEGEAADLHHVSVTLLIHERLSVNETEIESHEVKNGVSLKIIRKYLHTPRNTYELTITALKDNYQQYDERIQKMLNSFKIRSTS